MRKNVALTDKGNSSISIVIPVKNGVHTLEDCLRSILNQTIKATELLVIDSGSTDGSLDIIRKFPEVRLKQIPPEHFDHGLTRNLGVSEATGELVVFTVQDSRAANNKWLETLTGHFDDPDVVSATGMQAVPHDIDKNPIEWHRPVSTPTPVKHKVANGDSFDDLTASERVRACVIDNVTAAYRRAYLLEHPFISTMYGEDLEFSIRALKNGRALVRDPRALTWHYHEYNYEMMLRRTVTVCLLRHELFDVIPEKPSYEFWKLAYHLISFVDLRIYAKFYWFRYNIRQRRAIRDGVQLVLDAISSGPEAMKALREEFCSAPPIPENSRVPETA